MKLIPLDYAPSNTPISVIKTLKFEKKKSFKFRPFPQMSDLADQKGTIAAETWELSKFPETPINLKIHKRWTN